MRLRVIGNVGSWIAMRDRPWLLGSVGCVFSGLGLMLGQDGRVRLLGLSVLVIGLALAVAAEVHLRRARRRGPEGVE